MLDERGVDYVYREYRKKPLHEAELRRLVSKLGVPVRDLVRRRDPAFAALELSGDEDDAVLLRAMSEHPTLLQRPILVAGDRAVVGRPVENLESLLADSEV